MKQAMTEYQHPPLLSRGWHFGLQRQLVAERWLTYLLQVWKLVCIEGGRGPVYEG